MSYEAVGNLGSTVQALGAHAKVAEGHMHGLKEAGKLAGEQIISWGERGGAALDRMADKAMEVSKHILEIGAAAAVAVGMYGVHLNAELEQTKLSLASMFQAHGLAGDFADGMEKAAGQLAKMKVDVKTLPGDLGQLSSIMKMVTTPGAAGGANADQIRKLAGQAMLVGMGVHGLNSEMVAREMSMILQGHAGGRNVLGQLLFSREEAHKLTSMSAEERWKIVSKKLEAQAGPAHDAFASTWMAQITTLKDNLKYSMMAPATQPLFEHVKQSVANLNDYIEAHQARITAIADTVGTKLAGAWDRVEGIVIRIAPLVEKIGSKLLALNEKDAFHGLAMAGAGMLGTKMAGAGLETGSGMLGMLMRVAPMMGGGGAEGFAAGLGVLADPVVLGAAAVAAVALAGAVVAVAGAFDVLSDETSALHDRAVQDWNEITANAEYSLQKLGDAAKNAWDAAKPLVDTLGITLLDALAEGLNLFAQMAEAIDAASSAIKRSPFYAMAFPGALAHEEAAAASKAYGAAIGGQTMAMAAITAMNLPGRGTGTRETKAGMGGGGGGTHIQKVEIVVKGSDDPSRVARLTLEQIRQLGRNPRSSNYVPNYDRP